MLNLRARFALLAAILLSACSGWDVAPSQRVNYQPVVRKATVSAVRMTFQGVLQNTKGNSAASGAIVGGLFFGTPGVIVGAMSGSSEVENVATGELVACGFTLTTENKIAVFQLTKQDISGSTELQNCSLLRDGDVVEVVEYKNPNRNTIAWHRLTPEHISILADTLPEKHDSQ